MADNDDSFRQRAVIEFLVKEENPLLIFTTDQRVYGDVCMDSSSVRRSVNRFKDRNTII